MQWYCFTNTVLVTHWLRYKLCCIDYASYSQPIGGDLNIVELRIFILSLNFLVTLNWNRNKNGLNWMFVIPTLETFCIKVSQIIIHWAITVELQVINFELSFPQIFNSIRHKNRLKSNFFLSYLETFCIHS